MEFIFVGFHQDNNVRQFYFDGVGADRSRTRFTVGADLLLIRKYRIAMQELPLLCRRLLEQRPEGDLTRTFTEGEMLEYMSIRAAAQDAAALKRKPHRRPPSPAVGRAWRGPQT